MWVGLGPEILGWVRLGFEKVTHDQLCVLHEIFSYINDKNIAAVIRSWSAIMLSLTRCTVDDECYQQVVTVALC